MESQSLSIDEAMNNSFDESLNDDLLRDVDKKKGLLENLHALVLEMEWEIDDTNLDMYLLELKRIEIKFHSDKALCIYIKILDTLGRYLRFKKTGSHPETAAYLKNLYDDFEVAVGLPDDEKNRSAAKQVSAFKQFKSVLSTPPHTSPHPLPALPPRPTDKKSGLSDEIRAYIRHVVREEVARVMAPK